MIIASAQTNPAGKEINANLADHFRMTEIAASQGADLIVFPEMSVTGYQRERADEFAFSEDDARLSGLRKMSAELKIVIIAGAPIKLHGDLHIGSFIIKPDNTVSVYTKQFLHEGEEQYFKSSFDYNPVIRINSETISLAICADIDNPLHAKNAASSNTTLYISSIFFTPNGISNAYKLLSGYAGEYAMCVLMSNFCGQSWGIGSAGLSGCWNDKGDLIANLDSSNSGLLVLEKRGDSWNKKVIIYEMSMNYSIHSQ